MNKVLILLLYTSSIPIMVVPYLFHSVDIFLESVKKANLTDYNTPKNSYLLKVDGYEIRVIYSIPAAAPGKTVYALYNNIEHRYRNGEGDWEGWAPFGLTIVDEVVCGQSAPTKKSAEEFLKVNPGAVDKVPKGDEIPTKTYLSIREFPYLKKDEKYNEDSLRSKAFMAIEFIKNIIYVDLERRKDAGEKLITLLADPAITTFDQVDSWFMATYGCSITHTPQWIIVPQLLKRGKMSIEEFDKLGKYIIRVSNFQLTNFIQTQTNTGKELDNKIYRFGVLFNTNKERPGYRSDDDMIYDYRSVKNVKEVEELNPQPLTIDGEELNIDNSWKAFRTGTKIVVMEVAFAIYFSKAGVGIKSEAKKTYLEMPEAVVDSKQGAVNLLVAARKFNTGPSDDSGVTAAESLPDLGE